MFEVRLTNLTASAQNGSVRFAPGGLPKGEATPFSLPGWTGVQVTHPSVEGLPGAIHHTYAVAVDREGARAESPSAGLSAPWDLGPQKQCTVRFLLAWHQPRLREGSGRIEKHKYAERFADAKAVAAHAAKNSQAWLHRILAWQDVIYGSDLPGWLQEELINVPSTLAKNSLWLARTRPDDWWGPEGLFLVNESFATCPQSPRRRHGEQPRVTFRRTRGTKLSP